MAVKAVVAGAGGGVVWQPHLVEGGGPMLLARAEQAAEAVKRAREGRAHPAVQRLEARAVSGELDLGAANSRATSSALLPFLSSPRPSSRRFSSVTF